MRLARPSGRYRRSFLPAARELAREGRYRGFDYARVSTDFGGFVRWHRDQAAGRNLLPGIVPNTEFWMVRGTRFIGRVTVRHRLTRNLRRVGGSIGYSIRRSERRKGYGTMILRLVLPKARAIGLRRVLVTCNARNVGSRKIIERNGGIATRPVRLPRRGVYLRYWIRL